MVGELLQSEYVTILGRVLSIDEDARIDNKKGNVYFKAKIKLDRIYIEDSHQRSKSQLNNRYGNRNKS